jgi:hypothetical protein
MTDEKTLIDFYNYMKSPQRAKTINKFAPEKNMVWHSDLENFKALQEKGKSI